MVEDARLRTAGIVEHDVGTIESVNRFTDNALEVARDGDVVS
jgi:hypothetical protein